MGWYLNNIVYKLTLKSPPNLKRLLLFFSLLREVMSLQPCAGIPIHFLNSNLRKNLCNIFSGATTFLWITLLSTFPYSFTTLPLSRTITRTGLRCLVFLFCVAFACMVMLSLGKMSLKTDFKLSLLSF